MSNQELAAKYRRQLYYYLRDNYDGSDRIIKRDSVKDRIVISSYERTITELGLTPDTEEILKEVRHDNNACFYRLNGIGGIRTLFYKAFKAVNHVIDNKNNYMGCVVDLKEIESFESFIRVIPLEDYKGEVTGIGEKSICLRDAKGNKHFFWYTAPPLTYKHVSSHGGEIADYLIKKYGE